MTVHRLGIEGNITDHGMTVLHFIGELPMFPDDVIREEIRREYAEEVRQLNELVAIGKTRCANLENQLLILRSRNLWQRILNR